MGHDVFKAGALVRLVLAALLRDPDQFWRAPWLCALCNFRPVRVRLDYLTVFVGK